MADDALESDDTLLTSTLPEEDTIHIVPKGYRQQDCLRQAQLKAKGSEQLCSTDLRSEDGT
ncbi:uncharacterized protein M421DRAFT_426845 [Didymella exigua CBS 183.55]|uniref:Uncharacterized protein n=1 Tax=Didymella exigua CBS 183.55 TaxID=1150837 RepID=A0A6A5R9J2_9PLEO|nr:uncharacterized protein M421DRAFT_426845 [Didymella exigua CBS 183.55]KAF1922507.1 hypothetical protein M421DRAFT_426845 [Didymella exigua CBS 183.55]